MWKVLLEQKFQFSKITHVKNNSVQQTIKNENHLFFPTNPR
jgi:hypothetical protein